MWQEAKDYGNPPLEHSNDTLERPDTEAGLRIYVESHSLGTRRTGW